MIPRSAIDLIIHFEIGNKTFYSKFLERPTYRNDSKGIILGIGYDLSTVYKAQLISDWEGNINPNFFPLLFRVLGLKGHAAKQMLTGDLLRVSIPFLNAYEVFAKKSIPRVYMLTKHIYPNLDELAPEVKGALVSLVFCRGNSLEGNSREEMREIVELAARKDYEAIADAIERSKRHFEEKGLDEQVLRREAEADLIWNSL